MSDAFCERTVAGIGPASTAVSIPRSRRRGRSPSFRSCLTVSMTLLRRPAEVAFWEQIIDQDPVHPACVGGGSGYIEAVSLDTLALTISGWNHVVGLDAPSPQRRLGRRAAGESLETITWSGVGNTLDEAGLVHVSDGCAGRFHLHEPIQRLFHWASNQPRKAPQHEKQDRRPEGCQPEPTRSDPLYELAPSDQA